MELLKGVQFFSLLWKMKYVLLLVGLLAFGIKWGMNKFTNKVVHDFSNLEL